MVLLLKQSCQLEAGQFSELVRGVEPGEIRVWGREGCQWDIVLHNLSKQNFFSPGKLISVDPL